MWAEVFLPSRCMVCLYRERVSPAASTFIDAYTGFPMGSCVPEDSVVNINILFYIKLCREQRFACVICIIRVYKEYSFYMLIYVLARQVIFVLVLYVRLCI